MRIFFVGIHNKIDMEPLDGRTKSGKMIDRIISRLPEYTCHKSNVFNIDYLPKERKLETDIQWVENWIERMDYKSGDIIVCLGQMVQGVFTDWRKFKCTAPSRPLIVNVGHPSAVWSHENKDKYIETSLSRIIATIDAATIK